MNDIGLALAVALVFVLIVVDVIHEYRKASPKARWITQRKVTMIGRDGIEKVLSRGARRRHLNGSGKVLPPKPWPSPDDILKIREELRKRYSGFRSVRKY